MGLGSFWLDFLVLQKFLVFYIVCKKKNKNVNFYFGVIFISLLLWCLQFNELDDFCLNLFAQKVLVQVVFNKCVIFFVVDNFLF